MNNELELLKLQNNELMKAVELLGDQRDQLLETLENAERVMHGLVKYIWPERPKDRDPLMKIVGESMIEESIELIAKIKADDDE